jgi:hypothetical protein
MSKKIGLGWHPQPKDKRDFIFDDRSELGTLGAGYLNLRTFVRHVQDQGRTGTCVAQSYKMGVQLRESIKGLPFDEASAYFLYVLAQLQYKKKLSDDGLYPRYAMKAAQKYGICSTQIFKDSRLNFLRMPKLTAVMNAQPRRLGRYESIPSNSSETGEAIRVAISRGLPVLGGFQVGEEWFTAKPGQVLEQPTKSVGGHMITILGQGSVAGTYEFVNSWGESWADRGFGLLSADYVEKHASDLTVFDGWRRIAS